MWQDWYFALSGAVYSVVLIPSCLNRSTEVPRRSSIPTAVMLVFSTLVWATLGMWWSAGLSAVAVLPWAFLAWRRPIRQVTTGWRMQLSDEREIELVEDYRKWQRDQRDKTLAAKLEAEA